MTTRKVDHDFLLGDTVKYYTDPGGKHRPGWRGPAVVVAVKKDLVLVRHGSGYFRRHPHHVRPHVPGLGREDHKWVTSLGVPGAAVAAPEEEKDEDGLRVLEERSKRVEPGTEIHDVNETIKEDHGSKQETLDRAPQEPVADQHASPDQEIQDQKEEAVEIEEPEDKGHTE